MNTTILTQQDQRWMAALAGRPLPPPQPPPRSSEPQAIHDDDEDMEIARLLHEVMSEAEEPEPEPLDEATVRRVLNSLEARGSFALALEAAAQARAQASAQAARAHPARRGSVPWTWPTTRPAAAGRLAAAATSRPGWALACTALLALLATAVLLLRGPAPDPNPPHPYSKDFQVAGVQQVHSRQPDAEAARLVTVLSEWGISAQVQPAGPHRLVRAMLPVVSPPGLEAALQEQGLHMPGNKHLAVQFLAKR